MIDTTTWPCPTGGWRIWVFEAPYSTAAHPQQSPKQPFGDGANCQRYAYGVLSLFGRIVSNHRSSELWDAADLDHPALDDAADLDLALFSPDGSAWGAHVAVVIGSSLLHLSAEVGRPAVWSWEDFAACDRYRSTVGLVRCRAVALGAGQLPP